MCGVLGWLVLVMMSYNVLTWGMFKWAGGGAIGGCAHCLPAGKAVRGG